MTKRTLLLMFGAATWPARVYGAGGWLLIVVMAAFLLCGVVVFAGCGGGGNRIGPAAPGSYPGIPDSSISVAAGNAIVSKLDTALARIEKLELNVAATATLQGLGNYSSQFGVGAATCVAAALTIVLLAVWRVCTALREVILRLCDTIDRAVAAMAALLHLDEIGDQQRDLSP